jgi:hypothetical protein
MSEHESPVSPNKPTEASTTEPVNQGRRRLSKAALAAPVVVASLSARPAMACSVSGFISGNTSPGRTPPTCEGNGCTPGFWKTHPELWESLTGYSAGACARSNPSGQCQEWTVGGATLFAILGDCTNPFISAPSNAFLLDILLKGVTGNSVKNEYADVCHYICAILNAAATPAYGSTVEEIQKGLCIAAGKGEVNYYTTVLLARLNERGCVYDSQGRCIDGFVMPDGKCIPACPDHYHFDPDSMKCVPDT